MVRFVSLPFVMPNKIVRTFVYVKKKINLQENFFTARPMPNQQPEITTANKAILDQSGESHLRWMIKLTEPEKEILIYIHLILSGR